MDNVLLMPMMNVLAEKYRISDNQMTRSLDFSAAPIRERSRETENIHRERSG